MPSAAEEFPPTPSSIGVARRFVLACLSRWGVHGVEDDVRTVVSELATNAVLHARTAFTVTIDRKPRALRIAVADGSAAHPHRRRYSDQDSTTGRGLMMVAQLSSAWGVESTGNGKSTWCEFVLEAGGARRDETADDENEVEALLARFDEPEPDRRGLYDRPVGRSALVEAAPGAHAGLAA